MNLSNQIQKELKELSSVEKASASSWFFKTGKDQYGEGDKFIGVTVPEQRKIAKKYYKEISFEELKSLLHSNIHEHRLTSLLILVYKFQRADTLEKSKILSLYLNHRGRVNNWDLVDSSASIVGISLLDMKDRSIIYKLAKSKSIWDRRIAIISTYDFIKNNQFEDTFEISGILINDTNDLIHKAVGWMVREVGKRDLKAEEKFLKKYYKKMPRTMLRYAIEKFPEEKRKLYLAGEI